jgi:hypothetical protein
MQVPHDRVATSAGGISPVRRLLLVDETISAWRRGGQHGQVLRRPEVLDRGEGVNTGRATRQTAGKVMVAVAIASSLTVAVSACNDITTPSSGVVKPISTRPAPPSVGGDQLPPGELNGNFTAGGTSRGEATPTPQPRPPAPDWHPRSDHGAIPPPQPQPGAPAPDPHSPPDHGAPPQLTPTPARPRPTLGPHSPRCEDLSCFDPRPKESDPSTPQPPGNGPIPPPRTTATPDSRNP